MLPLHHERNNDGANFGEISVYGRCTWIFQGFGRFLALQHRALRAAADWSCNVSSSAVLRLLDSGVLFVGKGEFSHPLQICASSWLAECWLVSDDLTALRP